MTLSGHGLMVGVVLQLQVQRKLRVALKAGSNLVIFCQDVKDVFTDFLGTVQVTGTTIVDWTGRAGPIELVLHLCGAHFPVDKGGVAMQHGCLTRDRGQSWDRRDGGHWRRTQGVLASVGLGWEGVTPRVGGGDERGDVYRWGHSNTIAKTNWVSVKVLHLHKGEKNQTLKLDTNCRLACSKLKANSEIWDFFFAEFLFSSVQYNLFSHISEDIRHAFWQGFFCNFNWAKPYFQG